MYSRSSNVLTYAKYKTYVIDIKNSMDEHVHTHTFLLHVICHTCTHLPKHIAVFYSSVSGYCRWCHCWLNCTVSAAIATASPILPVLKGCVDPIASAWLYLHILYISVCRKLKNKFLSSRLEVRLSYREQLLNWWGFSIQLKSPSAGWMPASVWIRLLPQSFYSQENEPRKF